MKKIKKFCLGIAVLSLLVLLVGCKTKKDETPDVKEPNFNIQENIVLESNENINWKKYIEIVIDEEVINLDLVEITLISGDNTKDGVCTYEISYQGHKKSFTVTFDYPEISDPVIVINVTQPIKLSSDKDINWASYITITSDSKPVTVTKDMVTLISGDSSVSGECQYEVNYQGQKKSFKVTFDYEPVIAINVTQPIKLDSDKGINWATYITITSDENKVEVTDNMITLISGDSSVSGECEYEVNYKGQKKSFTVTFEYEPVIIINVTQPIKLTSDQDIEWATYITITSDGNKVEITDNMITLISGDSSVSGECEYEVNYQGQKKSFTITFEYSQVSTSLTASQKLTWNRAIAKDYSNMTVLDQVLGHYFYVTPTMIRCDIDEASYYMQPKNNGYEIYRDGNWVTATKNEIAEYVISFDFSKIDISLFTFDEEYQVYLYHSSDLSFCPYYTSLNDYFEEVWFGVYDNYISYIGFVEGETVYQCVLCDFGTTDAGTPTDQPIITPDETLGDLQAKENGASVEVFGIVVGKTTRGILIKDLDVDEYIYVYKNGTVDVNIGATVYVAGSISEFGGAKQIASPTIEVMEESGEVDFNPTPFTGSDITAYASNVVVGVPVSVTGTLAVSGNYYNFNVSGTSVIVSICYPEQEISSYNGQEITINGYLIYLSGSKTKYANLVLVSVGEEEQPQPDETVTELTDEQLAAWNESLALDYSQYTLTDSVNSYMENIDHSLYYFVSFDDNAYTIIDYYKNESNGLYVYTASGWSKSSSNPLITVNFEALKNLSVEKIKYQDEAGNYYISTSDLSVSSLIPAWSKYNTASSILIELYPTQLTQTNEDEQELENVPTPTCGIAKISVVTKSDTHYIFISNIGTATVEDPEETCNFISITDIQDLATNSLCTVSGTVLALTNKGFLVGDNINRINNCVYVNTGSLPTYQIGDQVKVFGKVTA